MGYTDTVVLFASDSIFNLIIAQLLSVFHSISFMNKSNWYNCKWITNHRDIISTKEVDKLGIITWCWKSVKPPAGFKWLITITKWLLQMTNCKWLPTWTTIARYKGYTKDICSWRTWVISDLSLLLGIIGHYWSMVTCQHVFNVFINDYH